MQILELKQINRLMGIYTILSHMALTVLQSTYVQWPYQKSVMNKSSKNQLSNEQERKSNNTIIKLRKNLYVRFK